MNRTAKVERRTKETQICLELNLDGQGIFKGSTGIGFFDHMLDGFARHGFFDLFLEMKGDLEVDGHHTIEDFGIVLGTAFKEALGDKRGIRRYGDRVLPMDETLVMAAVDLCGRPYLSFQAEFPREKVGDMETEMVQEFFYAFAYSCGMNLHIRVLDGRNCHHIIEAIFKAAAKALDEAVSEEPRISGVLSTKGSL